MAVIIGSARVDERGTYSGGSSTNNIPKEISTQEWYPHSKGWYVLRPNDSIVAEKIAENMESACESKYIGYDQSQNNTLYKAVKPLAYEIAKLKTYCETDCARLVRVCILYAGIYVEDFYTGNMKDYIMKTGKFTLFTSDDYCKSSKNLKRGDILVTRTKGHTVVVLSNGSNVTSTKPVASTLKLGSKGFPVKELQQNLIKLGYSCGNAGADGDFGVNTEEAVRAFQKDNNISPTGIVCSATLAKIAEQLKLQATVVKPIIPNVTKKEFYTDAVEWAIEKGITSEKTMTSFNPTRICTRAEAITFLWRANGCPKPAIKEYVFTDVKSSDYFYDAVMWALGKGITTGISKDKFAPHQAITRGQFVTFLWRSKGKPDSLTTCPFTDVKIGTYYYEAVLWVAKNNITVGKTRNTFAPDDPCTRAEIVTFLHRSK